MTPAIYLIHAMPLILQVAGRLAFVVIRLIPEPHTKRPLQAEFNTVPDRFVTQVTDFNRLLRPHCVATFLQLELFWIYIMS